MNKTPIGVFDSGIGGLTVLKELKKVLPHETFIYFGDTKHCPYGNKSLTFIKKRVNYITRFLISKKCKLIVVACNTITTNLIFELRKNYPIPFIGIEPAIKPAALNTKTKVIGVLATKTSLKGKLFKSTMQKYAKDVKIIKRSGEGLVELIEKNKLEETKPLLKKYLQPMLVQNIDQLVLGCTHYPLIKKQIQQVVGKKVKMVDPAPAVAKQTKKILKEKNLLNNSKNVGKLAFHFSKKSNLNYERFLK